jgi:hypothetical protein
LNCFEFSPYCGFRSDFLAYQVFILDDLEQVSLRQPLAQQLLAGRRAADHENDDQVFQKRVADGGFRDQVTRLKHETR